MIRKDSNCESASDSYPPVSPIRSEWSSDHLQILTTYFLRGNSKIFILKNALWGRACEDVVLWGSYGESDGILWSSNYQNIH